MKISKMFKRIASMGMALAMAMSCAAVSAGAADTSLSDGTYSITANLYVPAEKNEVAGVNAYLTNSFVMPTWAVSDNATLTVADGTAKLTVPVVNNTFALIELGKTTSTGVSNITTTKNTSTYGNNVGRVTEMSMNITEGTTGVSFTGNHQYSSYIVSVGDKDFDMQLDVDWSSVKAK